MKTFVLGVNIAVGIGFLAATITNLFLKSFDVAWLTIIPVVYSVLNTGAICSDE